MALPISRVQGLQVGVSPGLRVAPTVVVEGDAVVLGIGLPALDLPLGVLVDVVAEVHDDVDVGLGERAVHLEAGLRSEEHTSELQSLMRISYAVFCLQKKKQVRIY